MNKNLPLLLLLPFLMGACSPRVSTLLTIPYPPLDYNENVRIIGVHEPVPKQAEVIGTVKIGDSGFSVNCGWDLVIERARTEARKAGGNALKITEHRQPDLASTCHRISANILKISPVSEDIADTESYYSPVRQQARQQDEYEFEPEVPKLRLGINGGWSSRIAKVSDNVQPDLRAYIAELKKGINFGADATYYFSDQLGLGIKYNSYFASNSMDVYVNNPNGYTQNGKMSDQILINFYGPTINSRYMDMSKKNAFFMGFGIGYMSYLNNSKLINESMKINSGTMGLAWDLGYDIGLNPNTALGFQLSFLTGVLTQYDLTQNGSTTTVKLNENSYESLARIDLTVGLRFLK